MATRIKKVNNETTEDVLVEDSQISTDELDTPTASGPTPTVAGTFAVYQMNNGGMHFVYRLAGTEEDIHQDIPAFAVKMAMQAFEGKGPMASVAKMLGR